VEDDPVGERDAVAIARPAPFQACRPPATSSPAHELGELGADREPEAGALARAGAFPVGLDEGFEQAGLVGPRIAFSSVRISWLMSGSVIPAACSSRWAAVIIGCRCP
jgi:hypothetical protein